MENSLVQYKYFIIIAPFKLLNACALKKETPMTPEIKQFKT